MGYLQSTKGRAASGACGVTFPGSVALHSMLLAAVALESDTDTVSTIVYSGGGTFVPCGTIKSSGVSSISGQIFVLADSPSGAGTVTVTPTGGATNLEIHEYSGYDLTSPLGQHNEGTGSGGTAADSGNITTTTVNELLFGLIISNRGITVGAGFTLRESDAFNIFNITEDQIAVSSGTTASATGTLASAGTWIACIATFKLAGGGGAAPAYRDRMLRGVG